jgi:hypothetical protein
MPAIPGIEAGWGPPATRSAGEHPAASSWPNVGSFQKSVRPVYVTEQ